MELFTTDNDTIIPDVNTLLIYPFDEIWARDTSERKEQAMREFKYIEFLCSFKKTNPFAGYDDDIKELKVRQNVFRNYPEWFPDQLVIEAINIYISFRDEASPSLRFYLDNLAGAKRLQEYYRTVDLTKTTRTGGLVNKPSDVARGLTQASAILANLESLREKVQQEAMNAGRTRANRTVNHFEK